MQIVTRSVWSYNLDSEFKIIRSLLDRYSVISMDTEFPGIVVRQTSRDAYNRQDPVEHYINLKENVDRSKLIQIGISLSDKDGNLPNLGTRTSYIWEFNFKDFDVAKDEYSPDSVELLRRQGIDFEKNLKFGIESVRFAELMMTSGLVLNEDVSWVTFHSAYDFGYLVKCLIQGFLPERLIDFLDLINVFFGDKVFDVKHMMRFCANLHGGLDRVCLDLGIDRKVGKSHQAGSDSLATLDAFRKIRKIYFGIDIELEKCANVLYGLEVVG